MLRSLQREGRAVATKASSVACLLTSVGVDLKLRPNVADTI
jgi:hypothetical protein